MTDILILDDDPQILKMAATMLERAGYRTLTCDNGDVALTLLQAGPPKLLITDILMPGIDGIEMIGRCAQLHPTLKVVAMSGGRRKLSAEFNLKSAKMLGAVDVLEKPFTWNDLVGAVQRHFNAGIA